MLAWCSIHCSSWRLDYEYDMVASVRREEGARVSGVWMSRKSVPNFKNISTRVLLFNWFLVCET